MYRQTPVGRVTKPLAWGVSLLALCGCGSSATGPGTADLRLAIDDYQAQRYEQARGRAEQVRRQKGPLAGQAAYLQGLSAYQLGDDAGAREALSAAAANSSGADAARAKASLGLVDLRQGRPASAADSLRAASRGLSGEDARQASMWAMRASKAAADPGEAGAVTRMLREPSGWDPVSSEGRGAFTIQVGVFRGRSHADRAARDAAELAQRYGLAPVRIVTRPDDRGEVLYVVQLGSFDNRDQAADARRRVGNLQYIVSAAAPS